MGAGKRKTDKRLESLYQDVGEQGEEPDGFGDGKEEKQF